MTLGTPFQAEGGAKGRGTLKNRKIGKERVNAFFRGTSQGKKNIASSLRECSGPVMAEGDGKGEGDDKRENDIVAGAVASGEIKQNARGKIISSKRRCSARRNWDQRGPSD